MKRRSRKPCDQGNSAVRRWTCLPWSLHENHLDWDAERDRYATCGWFDARGTGGSRHADRAAGPRLSGRSVLRNAVNLPSLSENNTGVKPWLEVAERGAFLAQIMMPDLLV